jgi:hypothetical protein
MRKRLITPTQETVRSRGEGWLDVEQAARVEITSEDKDYPVESAFASEEAQGWRAAEAGTQTIRLVFDQPQRLKRISVVLEEKEIGRTRVRLALVCRWRELISGNCPPAVELQPSGDDPRGRGISS